MEQTKTCPLCAVSGKDSNMKLVPQASNDQTGIYCCVSCMVLMSGDEVESRWLELMAHYKKSSKLKALIDKFTK